MTASQDSTALVTTAQRVGLDSRKGARSVRSAQKHWQPPEGLAPPDVLAVIDLVLPNRKNPNLTVKRVYLPAGQADLPGALLIWANEHGLASQAPLFFSRKRSMSGGLKAISRVQAWTIRKAASERADVRVLALRASRHGAVGEPAPAHPHLFRHARVRQIVRTTRNLPLAQRQAGWSRLQMAYLTVGDQEARRLMQQVPE
jgi:integrase